MVDRTMKTIFVDMDGVLTDFNKGYKDMFGRTPYEIKSGDNRKEYTKLWHEFVDNKGFENLEWNARGQELVQYLNNITNINICILSSAGGMDRHREVQDQKLIWLTEHNIHWPAMIVPGRRYKAGFASDQALMIDDTPDVVTSFRRAGGYAILHTDTSPTIELISEFLNISPAVHSNYFNEFTRIIQKD